MASTVDEKWMAKAIELAWQGQYTTTPNPNVGCVIVNQIDGQQQVVGEGAHLKAGEPHAEVHALAQAGDRASGATAYVTLEPCSHTGRTPPCVLALTNAKVARVVIANIDPNPLVAGRGVRYLQQHGVEVCTGVLAEQAEKLNCGFFARMRHQRPYTRIKMAASLDGKTALANGVSQWITGPEARRDVQRFRAISCAVLTGAGTVRADDPSLLVRPAQAQLTDYPPLPLRQPKRYVLDSQGRLSSDYKIFTDEHETIVVSTVANATTGKAVSNWTLPAVNDAVDLSALFTKLASAEVNNLWIEAGATLAGALVAAGLYDELIVYIAPKLLGNHGLSLLNLPQYTKLNECPQLQLEDVTKVGQDLRLTYAKLNRS